MRRLVWVAVGAAVTLVAVRRARGVVESYLPAGASDAIGVATRVSGAARTARSEFLAGLAEREEQLRHDLVGDVDIDELRAERARRAAGRDHDDLSGSTPAHRRTRVATEDPDDADGDLPYSFY